MTSPTSGNRRGFTLIELLVVIGIILLLIGILVPLTLRAIRSGKRARTSAELQGITVGLEAYKADWKDYPRVAAGDTGAAVLGKALLGLGPEGEPLTTPPPAAFNSAQAYNPGDLITDSGTVYVCIAANPAGPTSVGPTDPTAATYWRSNFTAAAFSSSATYLPGAVVSYNGLVYVAVTSSTGQSPLPAPPPSPPVKYWSEFNWSDGAVGPSFRLRAGGAPHEAYLKTEKYRSNGIDFIDANDQPILYFPARPSMTNVTLSKAAAASADGSTAPRGTYFDQATIGAAAAPAWQPRYNADDNLYIFTAASTIAEKLARARSVLGDTGSVGSPAGQIIPDGAIDNGESAIATGNYILWNAGPDGVFGPASLSSGDVSNCDDVIQSQ